MKTKSNTFDLSVTLVLLLCSGAISTDSLAASAHATVSVNIVQPLSISSVSDMSFGNIEPSEASDFVKVQHDDSRVASGGVLVEVGSFSSPAQFNAKGVPNGTFILTLPDFIKMTDGNGNSMTVDNITSQSGNTIAFDNTGEQAVKINARLHVNSEQPRGYYNGVLNIMINYY
jgi:hypothetical protein